MISFFCTRFARSLSVLSTTAAGTISQITRGGFNMGWALSPSLADLAPSVLRWYFDTASNGFGKDFFVAGPSGVGYLYPSMYPPADLDLHCPSCGYEFPVGLWTDGADHGPVDVAVVGSLSILALGLRMERQALANGSRA